MIKKSEITWLELREQLKWEIKQLESEIQPVKDTPIDDLITPGISQRQLVTEVRNQKIRAMINELHQQIQAIGNRRGELIADKQWFCDMSMDEKEKRVFIDVYQHKKNYKNVAEMYGMSHSQVRDIYHSAFRKVQQEAKKRAKRKLSQTKEER